MKTMITVTAMTLAMLSHSAFAQESQKTRAQVQQELTQAKQDGSLQTLNRTLYRGGGR